MDSLGAILKEFRLTENDVERYFSIKQRLEEGRDDLSADERNFCKDVGTRCEVYKSARLTWEIGRKLH